MRTTTVNQIELKKGELVPAGTPCNVMPTSNPGGGCLVFDDGRTKVLPYSLLPYFFSDFEFVTIEMLEEAAMEGECVSVRGEEVEPDGYDSQGFPSILLAAGLL